MESKTLTIEFRTGQTSLYAVPKIGAGPDMSDLISSAMFAFFDTHGVEHLIPLDVVYEATLETPKE